MVHRYGYYEDVFFVENEKNIIAEGKLDIHPESVPSKDIYDCNRVSLIDGVLVIERWVSEKRNFELVMMSNNFKIVAE